MQRLTIECELPAMNEIVDVAKRQTKLGRRIVWSQYADYKKGYDGIVAGAAKQQQLTPVKKQVDVHVTWCCKDKRKDKDNIAAGIKFILDGLKLAKIIPDDNWQWIGDIHHRFVVDKDKPRVEVMLK